jgi:hypothetical protein
MRTAPIRDALRRRWPPLLGGSRGPIDKTTLRDEQLAHLAAPGVVYLTKRGQDRYGGVVAEDFRMAMRRARCRARDEQVIGLMGPGFLPHQSASTPIRLELSTSRPTPNSESGAPGCSGSWRNTIEHRERDI